ncbi:ammonium transporter [Anatilimnocola sp. NA78]|uniref:ammonium transporter n=1 Tax=Anatilimnocola sp. NA78 TaxID=3415683 RepID=UPI003CE4B52E
MTLTRTPWAGLLPALALCGALLCTTFVSAQEAAPEAKTETPAAKIEETKAEETKTEATAAEAPAEEKKEEAAPPPPLPTAAELSYTIDNMLLFICAVLVIFMQAGFALVETGLNSSKNAVNIMFKNYMDFVVGALLFFVVGYGIMYPGLDGSNDIIPDWFGFAQFGVAAQDIKQSPTPEAAHPLDSNADFLFQVAFAATAATIVSGSVAGRIKFPAYLIYTAVITAFIYPVSGMWKWGGGWLNQMGFIDFAGSLVVHSVGGFAGLAGAIALGPRLGRYINGKPQAMPGHNIPYVALGVFILMIGWYGFNPGSQLAFTGNANTQVVLLIAVNTTLAGCAGALAAMCVSWPMFGKADLTFALNGGLAGLVSITANCHIVNHWQSLAIGAVGGAIVIAGILMLDKLQIDDPVGAFPVHGCCGIWAGIATGLFGTGADLTTQIIGSLVIPAWALSTSLVLFFGLKAVGLLRVDAEEELAGLDICEHGMYAYPQNVVALDSVNSSFGSAQIKHSTSMATKPVTE